MKKVKINDVAYLCPDRWDEITLKQLLEIEQCDSEYPLAVLSALLGLNIEMIEESKLVEDIVYDLVGFVYQTPDWESLKAPSHLVINNKPYAVPRVDKATLGQNIMLTQLVAKSKSMIEVIPSSLAIYFQPLVDGTKFDRHRLPDIEKLILNSAALEAYATANFFMIQPTNLKRITQIGLHLLKWTPSHYKLTEENTKSMGGLYGSKT